MYYGEAEARELVIKAGLKLIENKLIARTWGNISARISKDEFIITPSGRAYEDLSAEDLVVVKTADASYTGSIKPSSEKGVHAAGYSFRNDASFIIHTHQFYASCVSAECKDTDLAACAEYAMPGSEKLKRNVEESIEANPDCREFLMARHGVLILGESYEDAFDRASELEERSKALVESRFNARSYDDGEGFDTSEVSIRALPYVRIAKDPYIMRCCREGEKVPAYLDDFAQIVGPDMQVVENDPWIAKRAILGYSTVKPAKGLNMLPMTGALGRMGGEHETINAMLGRNAVLIKGVGALCAGASEDDAEAIEMIVSKNCAAACYVCDAKPLSKFDSRVMRQMYIMDYSKRIKR